MKMLMHYRLISELTLGLVHKDAYADASYAKKSVLKERLSMKKE